MEGFSVSGCITPSQESVPSHTLLEQPILKLQTNGWLGVVKSRWHLKMRCANTLKLQNHGARSQNFGNSSTGQWKRNCLFP